MAKNDIERVKAAMRAYISDRGRVSPGEVANHCERATGLSFAATTIAKYLRSEGWIRIDGQPVWYRRPTKAEAQDG